MKQIIKNVNVHIVPCEGIHKKVNQWSINVINNILERNNFTNEEKIYIYDKLIESFSQ